MYNDFSILILIHFTLYKMYKKNLQQFSYRVNSIKTRFELIFTLCNLRKAARHRVNFRSVIFNC